MKICMKHLNYLWYFLMLTLFFSCVADNEFNNPENPCTSNLTANTTIYEVKSMFAGEVIQIQEDLIIEGYVISSDRAGNFFGTLHFQDAPDNPSEGFQIDIDLRDAYLQFQIGSKIFIKLKGLYLGKRKDVFKIGGVFSAFGNLSVGRLPASAVSEHILVSCDNPITLVPKKITLEDLSEDHTNTLIAIDNVEFEEEFLGTTFAVPEMETERTLTNCWGDMITLLNSGYSDFQADLLPDGNGKITGVFYRDNNRLQLIIRDKDDISFTEERCIEIDNSVTSNQVFISEIADPDNNTEARFVELFNAGEASIDLNGWTIRRYTNDNTEASGIIDLSGIILESQRTLVVSPNEVEFELVYGFAPDLGVSANSAADSNGDDNMELVDPFGVVIDVFGIPGEDGSGTNHEFEDGRALRNNDIIMANPTYTFAEWTVYNDTGEAGTTNSPQEAPQDFTPGIR